jgi:hypothetical protein
MTTPPESKTWPIPERTLGTNAAEMSNRRGRNVVSVDSARQVQNHGALAAIVTLPRSNCGKSVNELECEHWHLRRRFRRTLIVEL